MKADTLFIGIDGGGSSTTLRARRGWTAPRSSLQLHGPASNLQRTGERRVARQLAGLVKQAFDRLPARRISLCAGIAGAGSDEDQAQLAARIQELLPAAEAQHSVRVVHDAAIALQAAFGDESGMILIAGTGSIVYARLRDGNLERAGGWGYLIGDEGSGHALGIAALRAVAHALDGGPTTDLSALLAEKHGLSTRDEIIRQVYGEHLPVQELAPLVLEAALRGDGIARDILQTEVASLARQAQWLAERCSGALERQLALLGGLTCEASYREALTEALRGLLPGWAIARTDRLPVEGALELAASTGPPGAPSG